MTDDTHWATHNNRSAWVNGNWDPNANPEAIPTKTLTVKRSLEGGYERISHDHQSKTATAEAMDGSEIGKAVYDPSSFYVSHNLGAQPHLSRGGRYE
jgi:hypothetical protein